MGYPHSPRCEKALTIGLDARAASHPQAGGFKTYVKNLLSALPKVDDRNRYVIYVDRPLTEVESLGENFSVQVVESQMPLVGPVWREQVMLPRRSANGAVDLMHFPAGTGPVRYPGRQVVTIHDAITHMPPMHGGAARARLDTKHLLMHLYSRFCEGMMARHADAVITVSECSRRDVVRYLRIPEEKVRVVPEAPGPTFRRLAGAEALAGARTNGTPFILAIGSADPRKNIATLIQAYAGLPADLKASYELRLVWSHSLLQGQVRRQAKELGIVDRIRFVSTPCDEDLSVLYNAATVFVFPSLYEGFGLPPVEAMACGTPVISSNASSMPEVLGDAAIFLDPRSVEQFTRALSLTLQDEGLRAKLSTAGLQQVRQFSWERTAKLTLATYLETVEARNAQNHHQIPG